MLNLDLSQSEAKIARAREHYHLLKVEADRFIQESNPYTASVEWINPNAGVVAIVLERHEFTPKNTLGIILGDLIHNLRCALDYIVTALVDASPGATLQTKHQFPIFESRTWYEAKVGTETVALPDGALQQIVHGLPDIWKLQPFHRSIDPRGDPLAIIQRFSNADKHRVVAQSVPLVDEVLSRVLPAEGIIERTESAGPIDFGVNGKYEIGRVRYAEPVPAQVKLEGQVVMQITFGTPAFGHHTRGIIVPSGQFDSICDYVAMATSDFKAL